MEYVQDVHDDGSRVTFECPLCSSTRTESVYEGVKHACSVQHVSYPLLPTVSIEEDTALSDASLAKQVDMQLKSVEETHEFVERNRELSQGLLFFLPTLTPAIISSLLAAISVIVMSTFFDEIIFGDTLLLVFFILTLFLFASGTISVWGMYRTIVGAYKSYVRLGGNLSFFQFIAAVGNYYSEDPFTRKLYHVRFLSP